MKGDFGMKKELMKYNPVLNLVDHIMQDILGSYRYYFNDMWDELINRTTKLYGLEQYVDVDLCQDLTMMFGKYAESWNGEPNVYLPLSLIFKLKKCFNVSDELYKEYFSLPRDKRIALLKKFN